MLKYNFFSKIFSKHYKLYLYHNIEPTAYFKAGLFGKLKIAHSDISSRLEKTTEEECNKAAEECEKKRKAAGQSTT